MTERGPLRIGIAGLSHETNSYATTSTGPTTRASFTVLTGAEVLSLEGSETYVGGFLEGCLSLGAVPVPTVHALAYPSGTIDRAAYDELATSIVEALVREHGQEPLDAIALEVHGAGVADGVDDVEQDLAGRVRAALPGVPIGACLDLHGNVTSDMAEPFDVLLGVHCYPHTDARPRSARAVELLAAVVRGDLRPTTHVERLPVLLPTATTEPGHPGAELKALCERLGQRPGVLDVTIYQGFPFSDTPGVGMAVTCLTHDDPELAAAVAREAAGWVWDHRDDFLIPAPDTREVVAKALSCEVRPVVVNETSDNPGGGSPADGTHLLRALLDAGATETCFGVVNDAEVVAAAHAAGVGAWVDVRLGGKHDDLHGAPVEARAYVKTLTDGRMQLQAMFRGFTLEWGRTARLQLDGIDVVVSERPFQVMDAEVFLLHGIDVRRCRVVGLKSSAHFRAGFGGLAAEVMTVDPPGLTTEQVQVFEHLRAPWPLWPIDADAPYA